MADAPRALLIRRAAFDLLGLPPTREQVEKFVNDSAPDDEAFAKVVDEFLRSPRFGERWGRHWLDVVRYADSVGRVWNAPFVYAWRYRDRVIDSLNADKPYHRFVAEQIAGDLLPAQTVTQRRDQIVGTGMLALGSMNLQEGSNEQFLLDQVDDQIDVVSRAFLGLTLLRQFLEWIKRLHPRTVEVLVIACHNGQSMLPCGRRNVAVFDRHSLATLFQHVLLVRPKRAPLSRPSTSVGQ